MILFLILFFSVILISLILAYLSMKNFEQSPKDFSLDNGLFLIRKPSALTADIFDTLHQMIEREGLIISVERLFKGRESAMVLYGPAKVFEALKSTLDLLELEDYSRKVSEASIWQMGTRLKNRQLDGSLYLDLPKLENEEQVWWQIVLKAQKSSGFRAQIRVAVLISNEARRKEISEALQAQKGSLIKIPQPLSSMQMIDSYRKRSILEENNIKLTGQELARLSSLPKLQP